MKISFALWRSVIDEAKQCNEIAAVASLLSAMKYDKEYQDNLIVSLDQVGTCLYGNVPDYQQKKRILNGLNGLEASQMIQLKKFSPSVFEVTLCGFNQTFSQTKVASMVLYTDDLIRIFRSETKMDKFKLYLVFSVITKNMDYSFREKDMRYKFCHFPLSIMAANANMAEKTFIGYTKELERLDILYILHSNGMYNVYQKMRITNIYCRFSDAELCREFAKRINFMSSNDVTYDTNFKRKMKQIYNQIYKGKIDYDNSIYEKLIEYVLMTEQTDVFNLDIVYEAQKKMLENML